VQQVLLNLLSNAVKFTKSGTVSIEAGTTATAARVAIRDTGIGIKPGDMAALFRPFSQIDQGLARSQDGTGLGLVICRRLAGLFGGSVEAESEWGRGSVFTLTLPLG
jgi:signal transduction histidine kinase